MPVKVYRKRKAGTKKFVDPARGNKGPRMIPAKKDYKFKQINQYKIKPEPFPRVLLTRMKYSWTDSGFTVPALGTANWNTFRLNTIWDPDLTGGGTTTVGHSNMAALYSRYLVTGAKIVVHFNDPSNDGIKCGVRLRINANAPTAGTTLKQLLEQPMTYMSGIQNTGSQQKTFNLFVRPWQLLGISKLEYMANTTRYSSAISALPVGDAQDGCVFDIFAVNESSGEPAKNMKVSVKIVYYVQLYDRKSLSATGA